MTTPHAATGYSNPARKSPAETVAQNSAEVASARTGYHRSFQSSVQQYAELTGSAERVTVYDTFDTNQLSTLWPNSYGGVTVSNGAASVPVLDAYGAALWAGDLPAFSEVEFVFGDVDLVDWDGEVGVTCRAADNSALFGIRGWGPGGGTNLEAKVNGLGVYTTAVPGANWKWVRIVHTLTEIQFLISADGDVWTTFHVEEEVVAKDATQFLVNPGRWDGAGGIVEIEQVGFVATATRAAVQQAGFAATAASAPAPQDDPPPTINATIAQLMEWVGDNPARAQIVLDAENAKDAPRSTLVSQLEDLISSSE
jgi:hypothetical protein